MAGAGSNTGSGSAGRSNTRSIVFGEHAFDRIVVRSLFERESAPRDRHAGHLGRGTS